MSGFLGMKVLESSALPGDMVLLVRNGQELHRFIWTANVLAEQEIEIEKLRAERDAALRERDEQIRLRELSEDVRRSSAEDFDRESTALAARLREAESLLAAATVLDFAWGARRDAFLAASADTKAGEGR